MFQRTSLCWLLSELSPVCSANASGRPETGRCADPVDRPHHRLRDVRGQHLLRPVRRGGDAGRRVVRRVLVVVPVEPLHPCGALGVDDVDVGDLREGQQRLASAGATGAGGDAEVGAYLVRLPRRASRRARSRPCPPSLAAASHPRSTGRRPTPRMPARAPRATADASAPAPPRTAPVLIRSLREISTRGQRGSPVTGYSRKPSFFSQSCATSVGSRPSTSTWALRSRSTLLVSFLATGAKSFSRSGLSLSTCWRITGATL